MCSATRNNALSASDENTVDPLTMNCKYSHLTVESVNFVSTVFDIFVFDLLVSVYFI